MNEPLFIQKPPSDTVMVTALLLVKGKKNQEIADLRNLSLEAIRTHIKILHQLFETDDTTEVVVRMLALNYLPFSATLQSLPPGWHQYILKPPASPA